MGNLNKGQKTKNQHYVPRMYMARFGYGLKTKPRISVLFKEESKILHNQNLNNYASNQYFYDTTQDILNYALKNDFHISPYLKEKVNLKDEQFVEHTLSREEGVYKQMLDEIEENPQSIYNDNTRAIFISFAHNLAYRTMRFRDMLDNISDKTELELRQICDNRKLNVETKENIIKTNCISGKQQQIKNIVSVFPELDTMNMLLNNYDWYIGKNNTELDFIISDNPAQMIWTGCNDICIPISKQLAIILRVNIDDAPMLSKDVPVNNIIDLSLNSAIVYNLLQIEIAQRHLFGSEKAINLMGQFNELMNCMKGKKN